MALLIELSPGASLPGASLPGAFLCKEHCWALPVERGSQGPSPAPSQGQGLSPVSSPRRGFFFLSYAVAPHVLQPCAQASPNSTPAPSLARGFLFAAVYHMRQETGMRANPSATRIGRDKVPSLSRWFPPSGTGSPGLAPPVLPGLLFSVTCCH
jgi:hypothetical protein